MKKHLSILAMMTVAVMALSSCADDDVAAVVSGEDNAPQPVATVITEKKVELVDANGNALNSVPSSFGEYFLKVNADGDWNLQCDDAFIRLETLTGHGPALVPVMIGENWYTARQASIRLVEEQAQATRAEKENTAVVNQVSVEDLEQVKKYLSSNRGAGYSYMFNDEYCLGTVVEVFNMLTLDELQKTGKYHFLEDDFYPQSMQEVFSGTSKESVDKQLAIKASLGVDYNGVTVKVKGNYDNTEKKDENREYARMRMLSSQFTREINHLNCVSVAKEEEGMYEKIFAPGFRMKASEFKEKLAALSEEQLSDTSIVYPICQNFIDEVGPCLITKSLMGCSLDYSMSIESKNLTDGFTVGGALELKVKFATGSVDVSAEGSYKELNEKINSKTESTCTVRGGNVNLVSILASGGSLKGEEVSLWQLSVKPYNSVMINMNTVPIYSVLIDKRSHDVLENYITVKTSL